jgi:hypothetical protein
MKKVTKKSRTIERFPQSNTASRWFNPHAPLRKKHPGIKIMIQIIIIRLLFDPVQR